MNPENARRLLFDVADTLDALGVDHLLYGGTLLGAVREKGFIAIDRDVDLAMLQEHLTPAVAGEIVRALRCVDAVVRRDVRDKKVEWEKWRFDVCFVGDDWYGKDEWKRWTEWMAGVGVKTVYLPYSSGRSTSSIIASIRSGGKPENEF